MALPRQDAEATLAAWLQLGPALVALTRGADGPVIITRRGRVEIPGETITVADTVGAGDSFMAALICGLAQLGALGAPARPRLRDITPDELRALAAYALLDRRLRQDDDGGRLPPSSWCCVVAVVLGVWSGACPGREPQTRPLRIRFQYINGST
ncbi:carbohydrate kinase family protein [Arthrobacter sp. U41]|uniref:carbohydrate kinase family protein n=1 Tax=Arthrobacter sp. U41 TaxID=1849032 RepID=UPI001E444159|nr:PfkB family carbohydrate kinase [Arthrobacter sp. U41]